MIHSQQHKLSELASQLQSDKDKRKYSKVIEMSKIIQYKLDSLQEERLYRSKSSRDIRLCKKTSTWSLSQDTPSYRNSSVSDNATIVAGSGYSDCHHSKSDITEDSPYSHSGHVYKVIDRATCIKFQTDFRKQHIDSSTTKKPKLNTNSSNSRKQKQISFSPLPPKYSPSIETDEEEEEVEYSSATVHVAIRKDASLYKLTHKNSRITLCSSSRNNNSDPITELLPTPPNSPTPPPHHDMSESYLELTPQIARVYMKSKSIKGLFTRSYHLNQYTVTSHITSSCFFKAISLLNEKPKLVLKLSIVSVNDTTPEQQKRFGITFYCKLVHPGQQQQRQDDAKFAVAPDSLVREALATWINSQNEQTKGTMPSISKADDILRDGRKLYVIYDTGLFKV